MWHNLLCFKGFVQRNCTWTCMYETNANFPEILERAKITPTAKVKKPKDLTDFRTISIQTTLSKLLELAMLNQIDAYLRHKRTLYTIWISTWFVYHQPSSKCQWENSIQSQQRDAYRYYFAWFFESIWYIKSCNSDEKAH